MFKPIIKCITFSADDPSFPPSLRMVQSKRETVLAQCIICVIGSNGDEKRRFQSDVNHTFHLNEEITSGIILPNSPSWLSEHGFLTDAGISLVIKYELKIHRSEFDIDGSYKIPTRNVVAPISRKASKFDHFQFSQLLKEIDDDDRIVLESSDGMRFFAHKDRLAFASSYFRKMASEHKYEKIEAVSSFSLLRILIYIYYGSGPALDLFRKIRNTTTHEIIGYLRLAHETDMTELKIKCMEWLCDNWDMIQEEADVKDLMNDEEGKAIMGDMMALATNRQMKGLADKLQQL